MPLQRFRYSDAFRTLGLCLVAMGIVQQQLPHATGAAARRAHKRFIIHVPLRIRTHHHTHTIYSHIHSGGTTKQTIYKILGYAAHGNHYGHSGHHAHAGAAKGHPPHAGVHAHGAGYGYQHEESLYEDFHGADPCDEHHHPHPQPHGEMIFNHYARNSGAAYDVDVDADDVDADDDDDYADLEGYVNKPLHFDEWG